MNILALNIEILNSVATWLSALGTITISGIALWLAVKDRRVQLKVVLTGGVIPTYNPSVLDQYVYILNCINSGARTVTITNYHWKYQSFPFSKRKHYVTFPYLDKRVSTFCTKFPAELKDGQQALIFHPSDFFEKLDNPDDLLFSKNYLVAMHKIFTFGIYIDTSIGKAVKGKVSWKFRRNLWSTYKKYITNHL